MRMLQAPPRDPVRASDVVMRLVVVLTVTSAITFAATALFGLDAEWMVVSVGEALLALTLLSQT
jgi:hypothetical protein